MVKFSQLVLAAALLTSPVLAADRDAAAFNSVAGEWNGPGEIIAGKYKGTKFTCNLKGVVPDGKAAMALDGACRVGVFTQEMSARVERRGNSYKGAFLDGASGKGLDIISGNVDGNRMVFGINRKDLRGAMLAKMNGADQMNVTISVRVNSELVPVIGMNLKRIDGAATGSIARN